MVDSKFCNGLTETTFVCQAKSTEMNDIDKCLQKKFEEIATNRDPLNAYIRFFEYFLLISYRLKFKQWYIVLEKIRKICKKETK